jgi:hypothetical protein
MPTRFFKTNYKVLNSHAARGAYVVPRFSKNLRRPLFTEWQYQKGSKGPICAQAAEQDNHDVELRLGTKGAASNGELLEVAAAPLALVS